MENIIWNHVKVSVKIISWSLVFITAQEHSEDEDEVKEHNDLDTTDDLDTADDLISRLEDLKIDFKVAPEDEECDCLRRGPSVSHSKT